MAEMSTPNHVQHTQNLGNVQFNDRVTPNLQASGRRLLRGYSGIHDEEIDGHLEAIVS